MNPLLKLWILVLTVSVLLAGVFYMADHYPHIIGNFYFLLSVLIFFYCLYLFTNWITQRKKKNVTSE